MRCGAYAPVSERLRSFLDCSRAFPTASKPSVGDARIWLRQLDLAREQRGREEAEELAEKRHAESTGWAKLCAWEPCLRL